MNPDPVVQWMRREKWRTYGWAVVVGVVGLLVLGLFAVGLTVL